MTWVFCISLCIKATWHDTACTATTGFCQSIKQVPHSV